MKDEPPIRGKSKGKETKEEETKSKKGVPEKKDTSKNVKGQD